MVVTLNDFLNVWRKNVKVMTSQKYLRKHCICWMRRLKTLTLMRLKVVTTMNEMIVKTASYSILIVRLIKVKEKSWRQKSSLKLKDYLKNKHISLNKLWRKLRRWFYCRKQRKHKRTQNTQKSLSRLMR